MTCLGKAQTGDGGTSSKHSQPSSRRRWEVSTTLQTFYPWERHGTRCTEGRVGLGAVWTARKISLLPGFDAQPSGP